MFIRNRLAGFRAVMAFDNWPMLLLGRLFDRGTAFVIYRKKGLNILVDHHGGDAAGTRGCIVGDMYRRYLPSLGLSGPLRVIDLGANGGGFPLLLRLEGVEFAALVCVEMNPLTFQRMRLNVAANVGPAAVAINAAACGEGQPAEIFLTPTRGGTGESMYDLRAEASAAHVSVPTITLPYIFEKYFAGQDIDLCKIDIEGAEYEVLASTPDKLLLRIKNLIVEFHDPSRTPALLERIRGLGFREIADKSQKTGERTEVHAFRGPAAAAASVPVPSAA
jgi:FkbM family methyltransferase